ncbi:hypothetical protein KC19_VG148200 [Ceratodon purpureus]|uniref:Secreted protein n=1 Tax=Ceratodon purpureus TaxID=3225 RepID=A0A8T0HQA5_CERPU|nr:hypothetical protein KC19_VG148200 [Ceratodon purpureus]
MQFLLFVLCLVVAQVDWCYFKEFCYSNIWRYGVLLRLSRWNWAEVVKQLVVFRLRNVDSAQGLEAWAGFTVQGGGGASRGCGEVCAIFSHLPVNVSCSRCSGCSGSYVVCCFWLQMVLLEANWPLLLYLLWGLSLLSSGSWGRRSLQACLVHLVGSIWM